MFINFLPSLSRILYWWSYALLSHIIFSVLFYRMDNLYKLSFYYWKEIQLWEFSSFSYTYLWFWWNSPQSFFQVELPIFFHILLGTALIILLEFLGGIFCVAIFKKRYWNYSQNAYNFFGHIDLVHSVYWLLLVILFRMLFPFLPL